MNGEVERFARALLEGWPYVRPNSSYGGRVADQGAPS